MSPLEKRFTESLRENGARNTEARRAVFNTLQKASKPLPISEIVAQTKNIDRASVYRALALFEDLGIVESILVGWKLHFELAAPYASHHHHIYCEVCGKVISIDSSSLENLIERIAAKKGFHLHSHTLELSGCCDACKNSNKTRTALRERE